MADYSVKGPNVIADVYSGEYPVDLASLKLYRLIIKASGKFKDGSVGEDYRVHDYVRDCQSTSTLFGFYHFARPGKISEQISAFLGVTNKHGVGAMPPIVDVEIDPADYGISKSLWRDQVYQLCKGIQAGTGHGRLLIYTNKYYWGFLLDAQGNPPAWVDEFDLYVAWYPTYPDQFSAPPASVMPKGWSEWALWQYRDDGRSQGYKANDFNIPSAEYKAVLDVMSGGAPPPLPEEYIIEKQLSEYDLCFTEGAGELPLDDAVSHAAARGWAAAMNGGAGFDYADATHAIPKSTGFEKVNGIPYARRLVADGVVNPQLDLAYKAPWCALAFRDTRVALIVTIGLEGVSGMTQMEVANRLKIGGYANAYLMDSGHSAQIEEGGTMLYWPYGPAEKVPQFIGFKKKLTGGNMKGVAKAGTTTNVKRMSDGAVLTTLQAGDYVFGTPNATPPTDLINFDHIYRVGGARVDLGSPCKCVVQNLVLTNDAEPSAPPAAVLKHTIKVYSDGSVQVDNGPITP